MAAGVYFGPSRRNSYDLNLHKAAYRTTKLKLTFSITAVPVDDWKVPVTVRGYVPAAGPPLPPPHDGKVARVARMHKQKINPNRRPPGFPRRLPGRTTSAAKPAIPASPANPAIRFPLERSRGGCRRSIAGVVVTVTWA